VIVGRSAFAEPFALFGYDTADYDALFAEKLGLLLDIRAAPAVTWSGRFRPRLDAAADAVKTLGLDRVFAQVDWGGLPSGLVEESIARYATDIAPALRAA
jgi:alkanesulfonate monooxygenase SsuD/methylene tetrahydromethanopterin reductase-like flavin-dependent oxidoreductase (luciferase family)